MIDLHSHILPNIDDGSREVAETFNLIKEAKEVGFTDIISTSHYWIKNYEADESERETWINAIMMNLKNKMPEINIHIGSEIFVTGNIPELLREKKASTLNNTRYVLFELPFENNIPNLKEIVYDLLNNKYIPIIAHPERYKFVQGNPNLVNELIELGILFQSNYGSIIGQYGKKAQKTVKLLLENNLVHFLGSDVHRENTIYKRIPEILEELKKIIPKEEIDELTTINAKLVLANEEVSIRQPKKIKQGLFSKFL